MPGIPSICFIILLTFPSNLKQKQISDTLIKLMIGSKVTQKNIMNEHDISIAIFTKIDLTLSILTVKALVSGLCSCKLQRLGLWNFG